MRRSGGRKSRSRLARVRRFRLRLPIAEHPASARLADRPHRLRPSASLILVGRPMSASRWSTTRSAAGRRPIVDISSTRDSNAVANEVAATSSDSAKAGQSDR